ncbi:hypothetical protein B0H10DRAFT_2233374 [Mycena sp. CBHHK59/15]|nr:hypothetical protein B0H10DRAFT_2233374 [Mycena sp. CBHHK59/15]
MHFWTVSLFLSLFLVPHASSTRFHKVIGHIKAAQDKAFHDALLQQLADSRNHSSVPDRLATSPNTLSSVVSNVGLSLGVVDATSAYFTRTLNRMCSGSYGHRGLQLHGASHENFGISGSNNVSYVPTLAVDTIAGPYNVQCLQDPTSGQFCEPLLASYNTSGGLLSLPISELCTYCTLKTLNVTLSDPTTYSTPVAQLLSSAVTKCRSQYSSYNVSAPGAGPPISTPPFGVNATTDPAADCAVAGRNVSVSADTTCSAISQQYSVTTYSVLSSNPFLVGSSDCSVKSGTTLCLFKACHTYQVVANDICESIADGSAAITGTKITTTQLQSFNPDLGTYCQLSPLKVGQSICLTPNGGFPNVGVSTSNNPSGTPTTYAPIPTPTVSGTTSNCGKYYQVQQGDICNTVVLANSITLPDFLTLNPEIDANCTNLWLEYYYCVAPYPPLSISAAPPTITTNYTSARIYEYPLPTSYTATMVTVLIPPAGIPVPTNAAAGTRTVVGCGYYYSVLKGNYTLPVAPVPTNVAANVKTDSCAEYYTVASGDGCPTIEATFYIDSATFSALNPGINSQCTNLVGGAAYCVLSIFPPDTSTPTGPPSNVAPGTITAGCVKYYTVVSGDSCGKIETQFNVTDSLLHAMNPEINSGCTNIVPGEAYCVQSSNGTIPSNVAPGTITAGCTQYYTVVSGDSCGKIETQFSVTDALLRAMNPEINSGCTNMIPGEAYCVQTSNSTIPSNVAPGTITSGCTEFYTVVSGDSCGKIETQFGVAGSLLHAMNPEINSGCTNIIPGEAYCVQTSNTTVPLNVAPGTITSGCTQYYTVVSGDSCGKMETQFNVSDTLLHAMNPEINSGCTNIVPGEAYCVHTSNSTTGPPANLASGSLTNCTSYYTHTASCAILAAEAYCVGGGNPYKTVYTVASGNSCSVIQQSQSISNATVYKLNPWLDANCDLGVGERLCVG